MSTEASNNKRARTDEGAASSAVMSHAALQQRIAALPSDKLPALLEQLLIAHPEFHPTFNNLSDDFLQNEAERKSNLPPKDFKHHVSECHYWIDKKYARMKTSQQFELVSDISEVVFKNVQEIVHDCKEDERSDTQVEGIRALAKILDEMSNCRHGEIRKGLEEDVDSVADDIAEIFARFVAKHSSQESGGAVQEEIKQLAAELSKCGVENLRGLA